MNCPVTIHSLLAAIHWFKRPHPHCDPFLRCHTPLFCFKSLEGSHVSDRRRVRGVPSSLFSLSFSCPPPLLLVCFPAGLLFLFLSLPPLVLLVLSVPVPFTFELLLSLVLLPVPLVALTYR